MKLLKDYQERLVRLTDERLAHILEHPEMANLEAALAETLASPTLVVQSQSESSVELSYRFFLGTRVGDKWLCVVVKYAVDDAFILTAYLTDKPKRGEQLWPIK
jgi:hypothetical protein